MFAGSADIETLGDHVDVYEYQLHGQPNEQLSRYRDLEMDSVLPQEGGG